MLACPAYAAPRSSPATNNGVAHGKHGKFAFPDSNATGTGVACRYSGGRLTSVKLASPLAAARTYWLRGQYVPWKGKLEQKQGHRWKLLAVGHGDDSKPMRPGVLAARPPLTIRAPKNTPASGTYRVVEKLTWIANLPGGPEEGWAKHVVTHYHVGFGTRVRSSCRDSAPTVRNRSSLTVSDDETAVLAAPGLLAGAAQAQHDPLRLQLVSITENGAPFRGATIGSDGHVSVPTSLSDVGNAIRIRYRAIDPTGQVSAPATFVVNVNDNPPTAADQSLTDPATPGQPYDVSAPGLLAGATGNDLKVHSISNATFDPTDAFTVSPNGSFSLTPDATDAAAGTVTFQFTVIDSGRVVSAPATVTIPIRPIATDHPYAASPSQQLSVDAGSGLLTGATGPPGLIVDTTSVNAQNFDASTDGLTVNPDGSFTITPQDSEASSTLTFTYSVQNSDGVDSAPATVTINVGPA